MTLHAHIAIDARNLDVDIQVADGEKVAILGPNGAGKSSVLESIAGLIRPDRGFATLGAETLYDIGRGSGSSWRPAHSRGTALLSQDPLLFPHLTVIDNVGFGPRSHGSSRSESRAAARTWLAQVDAVDFGERKPMRLSGGQAQRIAVARALAADPKLLLLDEPMAALDVAVVPALRQMLRRVLVDRSAIIVTHDVLDALLLADRVIVIEAGRVVEDGPTTEVLKRPRSPFAARIAGLNMVIGAGLVGAFRADSGTTIEGLSVDAPAEGTRAVAVFSPGAVSVHRTEPGGSPRNVIAARVTEIEPLGDRMRVRTDEFSADITPASVASLDLVPGSDVLLVVKANEVTIYAA